MTAALQGLEQAVEAPRRDGAALGSWRWLVRQRLAAVRDALVAEVAGPQDGWLAARGGTAFGERNVLLGRLGVLGRDVLETADAEAVRDELHRLLADIARHLRRLHDPAPDEVGREVGGSEQAGPADPARTS